MPSDHEQFRELALVLPALQLGHYLRQAAQMLFLSFLADLIPGFGLATELTVHKFFPQSNQGKGN